LHWKEQVDESIRKGTEALMAVSRLTRPTFGMPHKYIQHPFVSVVIPTMEYSLVVWYNPVHLVPGSTRLCGTVGFARWVGKVQRIATSLITGGFKSTATDTLDYHAFLPP
ncbi:hypothetical protein K439DRAFT_1292095, partial [Ramaria rubella]